MPRNKGFNEYEIIGDKAIIHVTRKNGDNYQVIVDSEDLKKISKYRWYVTWRKCTRSFYAQATIYLPIHSNNEKRNTTVYMHKLIVDSECVDHRDHDTLNNSKNNLRISSQDNNLKHRKGKNSNNKSGYRNVFWSKPDGKWVVTLCKNYKTIHIGMFDDVDEAGRSAQEAREKHYGEFAGNN